jgi:redox-sensitive bicupin YhaK (pirin superfamily)
MDRKKFLKGTILFSALGVVNTPLIFARKNEEELTELTDQVGFNHLPNKTEKTMRTVIHRAETRGHANHGWLNTYHTFSFANYRNPERMHFGVLRVLNDDVVTAARGFGKHPHDNMEIISIPLAGDLEHKDSMGTSTVIKEGDVQIMSAGTGVFHSEFNKNADKSVNFLQIWMFPKRKNVTPRYDQLTLDKSKMKNKFQQILSPNSEDEGMWTHQDAWFSLGEFEVGNETNYVLNKKGNGVYMFVIEGSVKVENNILNKRDGMGVTDVDELSMTTKEKSKILLMEIPMNI